jgi:hypothetical protein
MIRIRTIRMTTRLKHTSPGQTQNESRRRSRGSGSDPSHAENDRRNRSMSFSAQPCMSVSRADVEPGYRLLEWPRGTRTHNQRIKRFPCSASHSFYQQHCWRDAPRRPTSGTPVDTVLLHNLLHEKIARHHSGPAECGRWLPASSGLSPQVDGLDRLAVREPVQGVQHQHRGHHTSSWVRPRLAHHHSPVTVFVTRGDSPEAGARVQGGAPGRRRVACCCRSPPWSQGKSVRYQRRADHHGSE